MMFIHPIISGKSSITLRPSLLGNLTYLDTDHTVVSTTNSLNFSESGWWSRILEGDASTDPNFDRFVGCGVWK